MSLALAHVKLAANLSFLYPELPFEARFFAAAADGFKAVEFMFPYGHDPAELADLLQEHSLELALFNLPPAGFVGSNAHDAWARGERGTACLPGREAEFLAGAQLALAYARALGVSRLHMMAGMAPPDANAAEMKRTYVANAQKAADLLANHGVQLLIEPINHHDMPGYFLHEQAQAHHLLAAINRSNAKLQFDAYHCAMTEGRAMQAGEPEALMTHLNAAIESGHLAHVQIAAAPGRAEPDAACAAVVKRLAQTGYTGHMGCEYRPADATPGGTSRGLDWRQQFNPN